MVLINGGIIAEARTGKSFATKPSTFDVWEAFSCLPKSKIWHEHLKEALGVQADRIISTWDKYGFSTLSLGLPYILLEPDLNLLDILLLPSGEEGWPEATRVSLVKSKSEGRRALREGSVYLNDVRITDEKYLFDKDDFVFPGGILKLSCGKVYGKSRRNMICTWW